MSVPMKVVNRKIIPLPDKFKELSGFTILHLSDLHLTKRTKFFDECFDEISTMETDIACITGDLINNNGGIEPLGHYLRQLKCRKGIYVSLGNHDEYYLSYLHGLKGRFGMKLDFTALDSERFTATLLEAGATILRNGFSSLETNGVTMNLYGAYYPIEVYFRKEKFTRKQEGIDAIITDLEQAGGYKILLSHSPDIVTALPKDTVNLLLSGHTHGGYVQIPNYGPLFYLSKTQRVINTGCYSLWDYQIHVSNGMMRSKFIPRIGAKTEATVLELTF